MPDRTQTAVDMFAARFCLPASLWRLAIDRCHISRCCSLCRHFIAIQCIDARVLDKLGHSNASIYDGLARARPAKCRGVSAVHTEPRPDASSTWTSLPTARTRRPVFDQCSTWARVRSSTSASQQRQSCIVRRRYNRLQPTSCVNVSVRMQTLYHCWWTLALRSPRRLDCP